MAFVTPEVATSQQGGKKNDPTMQLLALLRDNDINRFPSDMNLANILPNEQASPQTYYPSSSQPTLKGNFMGDGMSYPIFTPNIRFPLGLLDHKQNALRQAAIAGLQAAPKFTIEPPKVLVNSQVYEPNLTANWTEDVSKIISDTRKSNPDGWYSELKKPKGDLAKKVTEYENIAAALNTVGEQAARLQEKESTSNGSFVIPSSVRSSINDFYTMAGDWVSGEDGRVDVEKLNKAYTTMFQSPSNYTLALNELTKDIMAESSSQLPSYQDPNIILQETKTFVPDEAANAIADQLLPLTYQSIKDVHGRTVRGLPATYDMLIEDEDLYNQLKAEVVNDVHSMFPGGKSYTALGKKDKSAQEKTDEERPIINPVMGPSAEVPIGFTAPVQMWKNGREISGSNMEFEYAYDLSANPVEVHVNPTYFYEIGGDSDIPANNKNQTRTIRKQRSEHGLKGNIVKVVYGEDPFTHVGTKTAFAVLSMAKDSPVVTERTTLYEQTTTEGVRKDYARERSILIPLSSVPDISSKVNLIPPEDVE